MKQPEFVKNILKWKKTVMAVTAGAVLLILASFAEKTSKEQICNDIEIHITNADKLQFITQDDVRKSILQKDRKVLGSPVADIDLAALESKLKNNTYIRDAQVHFDMQGQMKVEIVQKEPVVRVINPLKQQYYLDTYGHRFPVSQAFPAHVPLVTPANFTIKKKQDSVIRAIDSSIFVLAKYIAQDEFASALTGQIVIKNTREFSIIPRLGNFEIYLGDLSELNNKFRRLKAFYKTSLPQAGWNKYKKITLKYSNQIIANR